MSKVKCFPVSRSPEHCRSKARRQLFFFHHSIFGVRYSAVLFHSFRRQSAKGLRSGLTFEVCQRSILSHQLSTTQSAVPAAATLSKSILAAVMKSFSESPPIAWVHSSIAAWR